MTPDQIKMLEALSYIKAFDLAQAHNNETEEIYKKRTEAINYILESNGFEPLPYPPFEEKWK